MQEDDIDIIEEFVGGLQVDYCKVGELECLEFILHEEEECIIA